MPPARPLGLAAFVLTCLATLGGLEAAVSSAYDAPTPLLDRARAYAASPVTGSRDVLVLGTCLPEQILEEASVSRGAGSDVRIVLLAAAATGPMDWHLALENHVPEGANVAGVLLAYGKKDLTIRPDPWESEAMDLATWRDLPFLVEVGCQDADCALEMGLRKASQAYRYRGWLANGMWMALGTKVPTPTRQLGASAGPGGPGTPPGGGVNPPGGQGAPAGGLAGAASPGGPAPGGPAPGGPAPGEKGGPPPGGQREDDVRPLERVLATAKAHGYPVWLLPLPRRELYEGKPAPKQDDRAVEAVLSRAGAKMLPMPALPLTPAHFQDDVHTTQEGSAIVSAAVGDALRNVVGG